MFDHHVREKNLRYLNYLEIDVSTMSPRIDLAAWLLLLPEDHNVAAILIAPSIGVAPLAGHHTFEEASAIVKLAVKDVHQVVNAAPPLELLKFFEGYFSHLPGAIG